MKETIVDGKLVKYYPGRLIVGFGSQISQAEAKQIISENGGVLEGIYKPNVADVRVPVEETICVLDKLKLLKGSIRFVSLDIMSHP